MMIGFAILAAAFAGALGITYMVGGGLAQDDRTRDDLDRVATIATLAALLGIMALLADITDKLGG